MTVIDRFRNAAWPGFDDHDAGIRDGNRFAVISGFVG
jgi:hypothetical protein